MKYTFIEDETYAENKHIRTKRNLRLGVYRTPKSWLYQATRIPGIANNFQDILPAGKTPEHGEIFPNLVNSCQIWSVITIFRLIWNIVNTN